MKRLLSFLLAFSLVFSLLAVSVSAAETEQRVLYDMETLDSITTHNGATAVQNGQWKNSGAYCLDFDGQGVDWDGNGGTAAYVSFDMTGKLSGAVSLRTLWWFDVGNPDAVGNQQKGAIGVTYKGQNYWLYLSGVYYTFANIEFSGRTYYTYSNSDGNSGDSIVLDETTLPDVTALNIYVKTNDLHLIDDIAADFRAGGEPEGPTEDTTPTYQATFSINSQQVDSITSEKGGELTLPTIDVAGEQLIAWMDADGNVYKPGATVTLTADAAFTGISTILDLQNGAGIRWAVNEEERGIRFETFVSKDSLDLMGSSKFEVGALILPYNNYNNDITVDNASEYKAVNVVSNKFYGQALSGAGYRFYSGVVDFEKYFAVSQAALADMKLTAVSYITVTYSDNTTATYYCHPDAVNNVRSVSQVARAALADTDFGYTDKQIKILELYTKYSQQTDIPEYRTDENDIVGAVQMKEYTAEELMDFSRIIGRSFYDSDSKAIVANWTASGFEFAMNDCAGDVTVTFDPQTSTVFSGGLLGVVIDEDLENIHRVAYNSETSSVTVDTNMVKGYHKIRIMKLTEADFKLYGTIFRSVKVQGTPAQKPAEKELKIEAIGDSITCGMGNIPGFASSIELDEDGASTYASFLANKLDADLNVVAHSGYGLAFSPQANSTWDYIYDYAATVTHPGKTWDFTSYVPDIVLVNLGTNDSVCAITEEGVKAAAKKLCDTVRERYSNCKIVWIEGMMRDYNTVFSSSVKEVLADYEDAYYCKVACSSLSGHYSHPNLQDHKNASEEIYDFLIENNIVE